jgi:O-antigen/teichoic acid export membrane protein
MRSRLGSNRSVADGAGLGTRAVRSGVVVAAGRTLQGVVSFVSVAILARLLTPSDFGVLATGTRAVTMVLRCRLF